MRKTPWFRTWMGSEEANTFAMFIVMLPMLLTAFGLGIDMTHNQYIRHELEASADMATVAAAAVTVTGSDRVARIDPVPAFATLRRVYAANRLDGPATLDCLSGNSAQCWLEPQPPYTPTNRLSVRFYLREQSHNGFLTAFGQAKQKYYVTTFARVKQTTR